jgi:UDP-N-acetylmuramate dehydrogenase
MREWGALGKKELNTINKQDMHENISLKAFNTFGIDVYARYFSVFNSSEELAETLGSHSSLPLLVLGGGSNILFSRDYNGLILKNEIRGIELINEDDDHVYVKAGAGENWHQFVSYCISRNWAGIENLSLIPGNVGASPMQNIGAYGVEIKETFFELEAFHLAEKKIYNFTVNDCEFAYRDSVFKNRYKNEFVILNVTFCLNKFPRFNISYGAVEQELEKMNVSELSIQSISQAVINIRRSRLADPAQIGNAGSFFKNPSVPRTTFDKLSNDFPGIIGYDNADGTVKLAAGWLIEQCGWKGYRKGDAGCYEKQALVLVNYGEASGKEIIDLSEEILQSVKKKFDLHLDREVNVI